MDQVHHHQHCTVRGLAPGVACRAGSPGLQAGQGCQLVLAKAFDEGPGFVEGPEVAALQQAGHLVPQALQVGAG